jgi:hypothetical protein
MEPAQKQAAAIMVAPTRRGKDRFAGSNNRSENDSGPDALGLITTKRTLSFFFVGLSRLGAKERSVFFSTCIIVAVAPESKEILSCRESLSHDPRETLDTTGYREGNDDYRAFAAASSAAA